MSDTTVKFIHSAMPGAPVLSGTAGAMIAVLDACLINGFGTGTVDTLVISSGVATVTRSGGHPFDVDAVAVIAGATVSGGTVNGEHRVLSVTATAYTFDATGFPDQTATGTITHKIAPLGWASPFTGANLSTYKSTDVAATGCLLRVDDTGTQSARVVGYESMTDVNTGAGPFPSAAQYSGGAWLAKSQTADATARPWVLVGDGRTFYVWVNYLSGGEATQGFGDILPTKSGDAYACMLAAGAATYSSTGNPNDLSQISQSSTALPQWMPRTVSGLGSAIPCARNANVPTGGSSGTFCSGYASVGLMGYPNPADGGLYVSPITVGDYGASPPSFRGTMPGLLFCPQAVGSSVFSNRDRVTGVSGLAGKAVRALTNYYSVMFIDVTGPWR
jgi:hypothetical protein